MKQWLGLICFIVCLMLQPYAVAAESKANANYSGFPPNIVQPIPIHFSLAILDISHISEVDNKATMRIETRQRWIDQRLAFDPLTVGKARIDLRDEAAETYLRSIWMPELSADDQVSDASLKTLAISRYADGEINLIERYTSDFYIPFDLAAFPFDQQYVTLAFSLPKYSTRKAILVANEHDRATSLITEHLSLPDWYAAQRALRFQPGKTTGWNAEPYSTLKVNVQLNRHAGRYILQIFVPVMALLAISLLVFWTADMRPKDRGVLTSSTLMGLAALSFTFESNFPGSISRNSLISEIIFLGFLYFVVVLISKNLLEMKAKKAEAEGSNHAFYASLEWHIGWALPALMFVICAGLVVRVM